MISHKQLIDEGSNKRGLTATAQAGHRQPQVPVKPAIHQSIQFGLQSFHRRFPFALRCFVTSRRAAIVAETAMPFAFFARRCAP